MENNKKEGSHFEQQLYLIQFYSLAYYKITYAADKLNKRRSYEH